jgi:SAM-dependent methyltransferase
MREELSKLYLSGNGIEIGALCHPLKVNGAVTYVDRMVNEDLLKQYPDLPVEQMAPVNIVDNGETLEKFEPNSQDFVIANHFLEHCKNPIGTLENWLRVLKRGGKIFCALPDKEKSFDAHRKLTTIEHIVQDSEGPTEDWDHFLDFAHGDEAQAQHLKDINYSIHYHVWDSQTILELLVNIQAWFDVTIRAFIHTDERDEFIFVIEKK